ncbi:MAG: hypothetical protein N4A76_01400 [Firmicutes bacterium]|nr:hypothetical protein [Bacillota bacterium]
MKKVLYYPNFEMENQLYMRIALLYFEELSTIVPNSVVENLSIEHKFISKSTNLLSTYNPRWNDSQVATDKTIRKLEQLSSNNQYYRNNIDKWRNKDLYTVEIFSEKYSINFVNYLRRYNLCVESNNGILVHHDIASFFMTYLAFEIRNSNQMNIICDQKTNKALEINFDDSIRHINDSTELLGITKMLNVVIPKNILEIPLDKIIELRNSNGYLDNLKKFHLLVDKYNSCYELDQFQLLNICREIENAKKEIGLGRILMSAAGAISFVLASYYAINNPGIGTEEIAALSSVGAFVGNEINDYYSRQLSPEIIAAKSYIFAIREI